MELISDVLRWLATIVLGLILVLNVVGLAFLGATVIAGVEVHVRAGLTTVLLQVATVLACRWGITRLWSVPRAGVTG